MFVPLSVDEDTKKVWDKVNESMHKTILTSCVNAFIVLSQNRSAVKKADITRLVPFGAYSNYRYVNAAVILANVELNKRFGMRLYELDDKSRYIVVNSRADYSLYAKRSPGEIEEFKVLYFILMEIFASPDEKVGETELLSTLSALGIGETKLKEHIEALMKRHYITLIRDSVIQDAKFYIWGPRAQAEVDPENFFQSFLQLTEDGSEKDWPEQKRRIEKLHNMPNR